MATANTNTNTGAATAITINSKDAELRDQFIALAEEHHLPETVLRALRAGKTAHATFAPLLYCGMQRTTDACMSLSADTTSASPLDITSTLLSGAGELMARDIHPRRLLERTQLLERTMDVRDAIIDLHAGSAHVADSGELATLKAHGAELEAQVAAISQQNATLSGEIARTNDSHVSVDDLLTYLGRFVTSNSDWGFMREILHHVCAHADGDVACPSDDVMIKVFREVSTPLATATSEHSAQESGSSHADDDC